MHSVRIELTKVILVGTRIAYQADAGTLEITKNGYTRSVFFQAEDGIRVPLWSRGLGDVYKRQVHILVGTFSCINID